MGNFQNKELPMGNVLCSMMGIDYPIILGGMLFAGRAKLVAAVSKAGGLGIIGAGAMSPDELRREIEDIREITQRPFGINVPVWSPRADSLVKVAIDESVKVVSLSAGDPFKYTSILKENGIIVIHVVPTVSHAIRARDAGVDAIVAEGSESGGFINPEEVTTIALVPQVVDAVDIPVIAAGGIADARGFVAALALGAVGIQMGTRFIATEECPVPYNYKKAIIIAKDTDTMVIRGKRASHRALKREVVFKVEGPEVENLLDDRGIDNPFEKWRDSNGQEMKWVLRSAGQSAGLVREVMKVEELILKIMEDAKKIISSLPGLLP
jgi:enoyl-[acyl-carrier protein] reductase II